MKKKILNLIMLALLWGVMACSDENDGGNELANTIVGSWIVQSSTFDGVKEEYGHSCSTKKDFMEFKADGVLRDVAYESDCTEEVEVGTYSIVDNKITLRGEDMGVVTYTFKIDGKTMTWEKPGQIMQMVRK